MKNKILIMALLTLFVGGLTSGTVEARQVQRNQSSGRNQIQEPVNRSIGIGQNSTSIGQSRGNTSTGRGVGLGQPPTQAPRGQSFGQNRAQEARSRNLGMGQNSTSIGQNRGNTSTGQSIGGRNAGSPFGILTGTETPKVPNPNQGRQPRGRVSGQSRR